MKYFVHAQALCESTSIGDATRLWAFSHVLPGAKIGRECNICDHVFIENDVTLGDRVTVKCGVQLWDGVRIEDDVFIGPNVTFSNDKFPRSKRYPAEFLKTTVGKGASIGANATLLPGVSIGRGAMIGAGTVVTKSVPPFAKVVGNPGRIIGYTNDSGAKDTPLGGESGASLSRSSLIKGVEILQLPLIKDLRGDLTVGEFERHIPFVPRRFFSVFGVPTREVRGEHAHRECAQFLICIKGSCSVVVDDGKSREEISLDHPARGVLIPPMIWGIQYKYSAEAVLLVFASHFYDAADYIRDYEEFLRIKQRT